MSPKPQMPDPTPLVVSMANALDASKSERSLSVAAFVRKMADVSAQGVEDDINDMMNWASVVPIKSRVPPRKT